MALKAVQQETEKRQRAILRQITNRRIKIATLQAEIAALQDDLNEQATVVAVGWIRRTQENRLAREADLDEDGAA